MTTRRVHRLRLRAPDEPLVRRGALLVEDALRTASLPDQRRLVLIRSLHVGAIHPARSAATLALRVEARVATLGAALRYADEPGAAGAPAVFFQDEYEPYTLLALRMLRRHAAAEWFWPLALPAWRPNTPPAPAIAVRLVLDLVACHGPAAGVALVGALRRQGALAALLAALTSQDGPQLIDAFGWPAPVEPGLPPVPTADSVLAEWPIAHWVERWGAQHSLSRWLAAVALADTQPARLADPARLIQQAHALVQRIAIVMDAPEAPDSHTVATTVASPPTCVPPLPGVAPLVPGPPARAGRIANVVVQDERPWSAGAGLFLLLPILARLGMADLLRAYPVLLDCAFPERLLHELVGQCGIGVDDPVRLTLPIPADALAPPANLAFAMPSWLALAESPLQIRRIAPGWQALGDDSGELALAAWSGRAPEHVRRAVTAHALVRAASPPMDRRGTWDMLLGAWRVALERWAWRYAQIDLRALIARAGAIKATPTHIDVYFDHAQADIRIRSAGVDIDPGWVPWLGRVVSYHYCAEPSRGEC